MLALLPLFSYGPSDDLVMRGCIAALALAVAEALANAQTARLPRLAMIVVVAFDTVTPLLEMRRATLPLRALPDERRDFAQLWRAAGHDVGELPQTHWLRWVMREAVPMRR